MKNIDITEKIIYIGANDKDIDLFESQYKGVNKKKLLHCETFIKKQKYYKRKVKGDLYEEIHKNHTCSFNYNCNHNWHNVFN